MGFTSRILHLKIKKSSYKYVFHLTLFSSYNKLYILKTYICPLLEEIFKITILHFNANIYTLFQLSQYFQLKGLLGLGGNLVQFSDDIFQCLLIKISNRCLGL